jgi:hypothetical protein
VTSQTASAAGTAAMTASARARQGRVAGATMSVSCA